MPFFCRNEKEVMEAATTKKIITKVYAELYPWLVNFEAEVRFAKISILNL